MGTYSACRVSGAANVLFPDKIEIDASNITFYKGAILGYQRSVVPRKKIACVRVVARVLFADIYLETVGGLQIRLSGFSLADAQNIQRELS